MSDQQFNRARKKFSQAVKRRRKELGLTQEEVADTLGMVARQYQKIESGEVNVTLHTLVRIALALKAVPRDLL